MGLLRKTLRKAAVQMHLTHRLCRCHWQAFQTVPLLQEKCAAAGLDYEAVCAGQTVFQEIVNPNPKQPVKKEIKLDPGGPQLEVCVKCSQPLNCKLQPVVQGLHALLHLSTSCLHSSLLLTLPIPLTTQQGACNTWQPGQITAFCQGLILTSSCPLQELAPCLRTGQRQRMLRAAYISGTQRRKRSNGTGPRQTHLSSNPSMYLCQWPVACMACLLCFDHFICFPYVQHASHKSRQREP